MDNKKRLAYAIIRFLHDQLRHGGLSSDAQESLEVAIQCLETAFGVTVEDRDLALPQTLPEIFEAAAAGKEVPQDLRSPERTPPSEEDSAEAERLKTEGNEQMKVENFEAAVHFYGKAIELNPANAVYFCNRAAAYSKLGNYTGAVQDCERAICIDPSYSKAYGRMGCCKSGSHRSLSRAPLVCWKYTCAYRFIVEDAKSSTGQGPGGSPGGSSVWPPRVGCDAFTNGDILHISLFSLQPALQPSPLPEVWGSRGPPSNPRFGLPGHQPHPESPPRHKLRCDQRGSL
uniref:small glutamine-rich tetratricopeptide repeat-containing protein alpha isoform X2 n=1 Tax=Halichoerus grypus TaxID=9711 RepID=UPI0016597C84|nr:small glutamine-rich tetratricopeptide repeat-containing protein alpha isoform X2 [Halichoerus grypus]